MNKHPEINLWAAVLNQAIDDLMPSCKLKNTIVKAKAQRLKKEAEWWIKRKSNSEINSFDNICIMLNLNPSKTRKYILNRVAK